MRFLISLLILLAPAAAPPTEIRLALKSGQTYTLAARATHKDGRVSFKTTEGSFLSVRESDVASESVVTPPPAKKHPSPLEDRQLGAIAREQREETGKTAAVAPPAHPKKPRAKKKNTDEPPATSSEPPPDSHNRPLHES
jgi:hypothetical protein